MGQDLTWEWLIFSMWKLLGKSENPTNFMDFHGVSVHITVVNKNLPTLYFQPIFVYHPKKFGWWWRGCAIRATRWMCQVACGGCSCQVGKE